MNVRKRWWMWIGLELVEERMGLGSGLGTGEDRGALPRDRGHRKEQMWKTHEVSKR
jgi:hypothetical protein